jgi:hypothetical protein
MFDCHYCNDTHRLTIGGPCTFCPVPCSECSTRIKGGAYCDVTPCTCHCHSDLELWRRTGRSTAMIEKAVQFVNAGFKMVIIAATNNDCNVLRMELQRLLNVDYTKQVTFGCLSTKFIGQSFDKVFVDHRCWEEYPFKTARLLVDLEGRMRHARQWY